MALQLLELGQRLTVLGSVGVLLDGDDVGEGRDADDDALQAIVIDAETLLGFGSTTWVTDAGSIDVLHDLPTAAGRRSYDELLSRSTTASDRR